MYETNGPSLTPPPPWPEPTLPIETATTATARRQHREQGLLCWLGKNLPHGRRTT